MAKGRRFYKFRNSGVLEIDVPDKLKPCQSKLVDACHYIAVLERRQMLQVEAYRRLQSVAHKTEMEYCEALKEYDNELTKIKQGEKDV